MPINLKKLKAHITRSWQDEPNNDIHPRLKYLQSFVYEFLGILIALAIIYKILTLRLNP
jgi:hypothetical protein